MNIKICFINSLIAKRALEPVVAAFTHNILLGETINTIIQIGVRLFFMTRRDQILMAPIDALWAHAQNQQNPEPKKRYNTPKLFTLAII